MSLSQPTGCLFPPRHPRSNTSGPRLARVTVVFAMGEDAGCELKVAPRAGSSGNLPC